MDSEVLTEVPQSLKRLARLIARGFYSPETAIVVDMLVRNPCIKEDDMIELLKFERKQLRSIVNSLKLDRILKARMRIETDAEGKCSRHNYYFINYNVFVNIVKYKLDHMRRKIEMEERDTTSRASFKCTACQKTFTDLEVGQMIDPMSGLLRCTICQSEVDEDESSLPNQNARTLMAKFNEQIQPIFELLRSCEDIKLAPEILEPEPIDISKILQARGQGSQKGSDQDPNRMVWSGEASRKTAFGYNENQMTVTIGEDDKSKQTVKLKAAPDWMKNSTVEGNLVTAANPPIVAPTAVTKAVSPPVHSQVDATEVMNTLLVHETKSTGAVIPGAVIPGADSESSSSSSEDEATLALKPTLLPTSVNAFGLPTSVNAFGLPTSVNAFGLPTSVNAFGLPTSVNDFGLPTSVNAFGLPSNDVEEFDSDDDDDAVPMVTIGDKRVAYPDITDDIVEQMTPSEKDEYIRVGQEWYKHMYE